MKLRALSQRTRLTRTATRGGGSRVRASQCRICLLEETWDGRGQSSLHRGICRDRKVCEQRQPRLL